MELASVPKVRYEGKLAIFTSFYSHMAYAPYVISLAHTLGVLSTLGIKHQYLARPSDFHIERAVNKYLKNAPIEWIVLGEKDMLDKVDRSGLT